jgi:hypothetical protein
MVANEPTLPVTVGQIQQTIDRAIESSASATTARVDSIEKALELFRDQITRVPTDVDRQILALRELVFERFRAIDMRFDERDKRANQRAEAGNTAMEAAFAAAKENTTEIKAGFTKSIDGLQNLMSTAVKATELMVSDLKERVTAIESRTSGMTAANTENRAANTDNSARMVAIIAVVVSLAVGAGEIVTRMSH